MAAVESGANGCCRATDTIHQLILKDVVLGFLHLAGNGKPNQRRIKVLNYQEIIQIVLEAQGTRGLREDMRMGGMED